MKKIFFLLFLFYSLTALSQNKDASDTTAKLIITEKGKPDGEKTELKIGTEGGTLTSSDGKVKLIVPESAVSKNTTFSIQPTTNLMPNGNGKGYQLEPSGIIFQKPLQIIFYYTDAELGGNSPGLLAIAVQDEKGQWSPPTKLTTDTVAKTLTAETWHFCTEVAYYKAEIDPSSARVGVNGSLRLSIIGIDHYEAHLYVYGKEVPVNVKPDAEIWKVNGIPKGNSTVGLISASQNYTAIFQAPAQVPSQNPVAVTVQEDFSANPNDAHSRFDVYTLVSNITIYEDAYEVKISAINHNALVAYGALNADLIDSGSFVVSLEGKKSEVKDIKNKMYQFINKSKLDIVYINKETCTGPINITGVKEMRVTWADPPKQPYTIVEIAFLPSRVVLPQFKVNTKKVPEVISVESMLSMMPAWPMFIKFEAKEGKQVIQEFGKEKDDTHIIITVEKLSEEKKE